jgi:pilin isopeptide linkage protein
MKANEIRMKKLAAMAAAGVLSAGMILPMGTAFAATTYTPVAGTSTTFKKFLVVESDADIPNTTFNFSIAPGTAQAAGQGTMEVLAGVGTPTIAANQATFAPSDATNATVQSGDIDVAKSGNFDPSTQKYASKNVTIDFSSVSFPEPGVYRYIVTESSATAAQTAAGISCDTDADRTLDVYVTDDGTGTLVVSGYVMHDGTGTIAAGTDMGSADVATAAAALQDKTDGFTNKSESNKLTISKSVAGNQASRDKYFAITVHLANLGAQNTFPVDITDADATSGAAKAGGTISANAGQTNPTSISSAADGTAEVTFYLQHGQNVDISGLPKDATYYVTENAEDYKSAAATGCENGTQAAPITMSTDKAAGFLNTRDGIIPTGILFPIVGGVLIAGGAGAGFIANRRRKEDEE